MNFESEVFSSFSRRTHYHELCTKHLALNLISNLILSDITNLGMCLGLKILSMS
jgi:hypothetical protein